VSPAVELTVAAIVLLFHKKPNSGSLADMHFARQHAHGGHMLRRLRDLENWTVAGSDDTDIGNVEDGYFDDQRWTVRYLVVNAGGWLVDNSVLVSPMAVRLVEWEKSKIHVMAAPGAEPLPAGVQGESDTRHLRSAKEISGYHIQALDGEIGHVEDFLFDGSTWTIRYLVIDTSNWIGGRTVLVSPDWVRRVDWDNREIHVDMSRGAVKGSPEYNPTMEMSREYEERLHGHYRRPAYWK
jgi:sporulation protein YlmC with PRC-barrel domain